MGQYNRKIAESKDSGELSKVFEAWLFLRGFLALLFLFPLWNVVFRLIESLVGSDQGRRFFSHAFEADPALTLFWGVYIFFHFLVFIESVQRIISGLLWEWREDKVAFYRWKIVVVIIYHLLGFFLLMMSDLPGDFLSRALEVIFRLEVPFFLIEGLVQFSRSKRRKGFKLACRENKLCHGLTRIDTDKK